MFGTRYIYLYRSLYQSIYIFVYPSISIHLSISISSYTDGTMVQYLAGYVPTTDSDSCCTGCTRPPLEPGCWFLICPHTKWWPGGGPQQGPRGTPPPPCTSLWSRRQTQGRVVEGWQPRDFENGSDGPLPLFTHGSSAAVDTVIHSYSGTQYWTVP